MAQQPAVSKGASALPLFYAKPSALRPQLHGGLSLSRRVDYRFARGANAIPLIISELALAQRDYPIVFTDDTVPMPVAVVGLQDAVNLMVESDGSWRKGVFVPAYARRYPFVFAEQRETGALTLCIDEASGLIEDGGDNPLFRDGEPSEVTRKALEFCAAYQRDYEATREFCHVLAQVELLVPRDARLVMPSGEPLVVKGFRAIDEERFNQLPEQTFLDWRAKGWIALIYAHLLSRASWEKLVHATTERHAQTGGP